VGVLEKKQDAGIERDQVQGEQSRAEEAAENGDDMSEGEVVAWKESRAPTPPSKASSERLDEGQQAQEPQQEQQQEQEEEEEEIEEEDATTAPSGKEHMIWICDPLF